MRGFEEVRSFMLGLNYNDVNFYPNRGVDSYHKFIDNTDWINLNRMNICC